MLSVIGKSSELDTYSRGDSWTNFFKFSSADYTLAEDIDLKLVDVTFSYNTGNNGSVSDCYVSGVPNVYLVYVLQFSASSFSFTGSDICLYK